MAAHTDEPMWRNVAVEPTGRRWMTQGPPGAAAQPASLEANDLSAAGLPVASTRPTSPAPTAAWPRPTPIDAGVLARFAAEVCRPQPSAAVFKT